MSIQNVNEDAFKALDKQIHNWLADKAKVLDKKNTEILDAMHFGSEKELLKFKTDLLSINVMNINNIDTLIKTVYALYEKKRKELVETIKSPAPQHYNWKGKTTMEWQDWYEKHMKASKTLSQFRSKFWIDFNDLLDHYYDDKHSNIDEQELSNWKSEIVKRMLNYFQEDNRDRWMYHFSIKNMENFSKATYLIKLLNNNNNFQKKQDDRFGDGITDTVVIKNKSNVMDDDLKTNRLNVLKQFNNIQLQSLLSNLDNTKPSDKYNISDDAQNGHALGIDDDYLDITQRNNVNGNINPQSPQIPQGFNNNFPFNFSQANIGMFQNNSNNAPNGNAPGIDYDYLDITQRNNFNGNINPQSPQIPQGFNNNFTVNFHQENIGMPHQPLNNNSEGLVNTGNFICYNADMKY